MMHYHTSEMNNFNNF